MSMQIAHTQAIANNISIEKYGHLYPELPKDYQNIVWKQAVKLADKQIKQITEI